jgi:D-alanyl-lipoteichoic acid acyltransferase DltB (MBOAT superfamily)
MEFLSLPFVAFIIVTFLLYYIKSNRRLQHILLLTASIVFIGYYNWAFLIYALGITTFTFVAGKLLHKNLEKKIGLWMLSVSIAVLVGIWLTARYASPFFPLGISFYTFQAISYLIEIYWEEEPEEDPIKFSVYMLLFMKFLSGPIERCYDLLPQLKKAHPFNYEKVVAGLKLMAWGAFMKLVIADRIAPSLDSVFNDVQSATGPQLFIATMLYPIQLYADFAGYTNMALGLGAMFGFTLTPNFDRPFISLTTGELWRRWHQSLSFWCRDYIYTPLSAELRHMKKWGIYIAIITTFVTIGVWHGAGWTFALYGLFQGVVIIYETATKKWHDSLRAFMGDKAYKPIMMVRTYLLFAISLLFFRIANLDDVVYTYTHMLDWSSFYVKDLRLCLKDSEWIAFGIATVLMFAWEYVNSRCDIIKWTACQKTYLRWPIYFVFITLIFLYGAFGVDNFIYIQF